MQLQTRWLVVGGILVAGLLLAWWTREPAPFVHTAQVRRAPLRVLVATNGKVEPVEEEEVRARFEGRIVKIPDPGKRVTAGEVVLVLDASTVTSDLAAARSERLAALESLRKARDELEVAGRQFGTDEQLFKEGALTRELYENSKAAQEAAAASLKALEDEVPLRVASLDLKIEELGAQALAAVYRAPFAGTVYRTEAKEDEVVTEGAPILWLSNLDSLRVRANIDQVDLGRVAVGQGVNISSNAFPGRAWTGRITEIVPHVVVKESRSISEGLAKLSPPTDGLVPGMTVDVEIIVAEADDALQVPSEAVFTRDSEPFVYRLDGSRARVVPVALGLAGAREIEVTDGLAEGDVVVAGAAPGLANGVRVRPHAVERDGASPGSS
jgi:HlyD family secretion protein